MKIVIVLGMHRGGTSLTANILHKLGVKLWTKPEQEMKATGHNKEGYYENWSFVHLNDEILRVAGGDWFHYPHKLDIIRAGLMTGGKIQHVVKSNVQEPIWGWKDPRTCLTFDCYIPCLEQLSESYKDIKLVVPIRDPDSCYKSFYKTRMVERRMSDNIISRNIFDRIYNTYMSNAYNAMTRFNGIFVKFENFFNGKTMDQVYKMADFIEVDLTKEMEDQIQRIVNPKIRTY